MSFFIQTAKQVASGYVDVFYPWTNSNVGSYDGTPIVTHEPFDTTGAIAPPIPNNEAAHNRRFFLCPIATTPADPTLFGLVTQRFGSLWWLKLVPNDSEGFLLRLGTSAPTSINHPGAFQICTPTEQPSVLWRYLYSPFFSKYVCATSNDTKFSADDDPSTLCQFMFLWNTSSGPVIPSPLGEIARYHIMSKYGKALVSSVSSPHLAQATLNHSSSNQKFYFQAQGAPTPLAPGLPFTYNLFFYSNPSTMLCFEDTDIIGTRTTAGAWEKFEIVQDPAFFGRFKIICVALGTRLRANSDSTVTVAPANSADTADDYFTFLPASAEAHEEKANRHCCCIC